MRAYADWQGLEARQSFAKAVPMQFSGTRGEAELRETACPSRSLGTRGTCFEKESKPDFWREVNEKSIV
jgi:hypothetical protein